MRRSKDRLVRFAARGGWGFWAGSAGAGLRFSVGGLGRRRVLRGPFGQSPYDGP